MVQQQQPRPHHRQHQSAAACSPTPCWQEVQLCLTRLCRTEQNSQEQNRTLCKRVRTWHKSECSPRDDVWCIVRRSQDGTQRVGHHCMLPHSMYSVFKRGDDVLMPTPGVRHASCTKPMVANCQFARRCNTRARAVVHHWWRWHGWWWKAAQSRVEGLRLMKFTR